MVVQALGVPVHMWRCVMRIKTSIAQFKLSVLDNEGIEMLTYSVEGAEFDGDLDKLVAEAVRFAENLDPITKAAEGRK